ncbi:hypothetical protein [Candidatus Amarobacter glycogenicus]|uniref:hypothetical protein n=1 Tax=Candidatus Amarobacter glycogenicus TaxID=3140699 RepID=UPI0031CCBA54
MRAPFLHALQLDVEVADFAQCRRHPAKLVAEAQHAQGEDRPERRHRRPDPPDSDAHVVQSLDIFAKTGAGLVRAKHRELLPQHRIGHLARSEFGSDGCRSQVGGQGRHGLARRDQCRFELRWPGGRQPVGFHHLRDEGTCAPNSLVFDFDLHAGKADRAVLTDRDRRLVDGNLR